MIELLAWLSAIAWIVVLLRTPPGALLPDGDADVAPDPPAWPSVTVVVPARNEAESLPVTLPRLLAQEYAGPLRVVVVDERSTDGTAEMARHAGGARVEVVAGAELPAGWAGKPWGMQQGLRHAGVLDGESSDYVLFTDADIAHEPESLRLLVAQAERDRLDLCSRMALLRCESRAEKLLIPAFLYFFATLYPMRAVADPASPVAASAGGCQLVRASMLRAMNGVEPIASRRIDDVALAREVKRRGGRLALSCSRGVVRSLRGYPRLPDVWRMVRRSAFEELRFSWLRLAGCVAALSLLFLVPPLGLLDGARSLLPAFGAWLLSAAAFLPAIRWFGLSPGRAFLLPVAGVLYGAMTIDSAMRHAQGRAEPWRGAPALPG